MRLFKPVATPFVFLSLLLASAFSNAGRAPEIPVEIAVGPLEISPVPTMTQNMLIALGVLMMIIALRMLRQQNAQKMLGLLVLGGGLAVSGVGVERSVASGASIPAGDACTLGGAVQYNAQWSGQPFQNDCPNAMQILGYTILPGQHSCTDLDEAGSGCPTGTVIQGNSGTCSPLPVCDDED